MRGREWSDRARVEWGCGSRVRGGSKVRGGVE